MTQISQPLELNHTHVIRSQSICLMMVPLIRDKYKILREKLTLFHGWYWWILRNFFFFIMAIHFTSCCQTKKVCLILFWVNSDLSTVQCCLLTFSYLKFTYSFFLLTFLCVPDILLIFSLWETGIPLIYKYYFLSFFKTVQIIPEECLFPWQ